jgi:hypothetical protein
MESRLKGRQKMNIKISKKRAAEIMAEEIEAFIKRNGDVDPKVLREQIKTHFASKRVLERVRRDRE